MRIEFTQYLHDEWEEGLPWDLEKKLEAAGFDRNQVEDLVEKAGRPFYEIGIQCAIDTDTGVVEMLGVR